MLQFSQLYLNKAGKGNGNPLWYSCLENSMDRGAGWATVHGVADVDLTEELTLHTLSPTPKPQTPHRVEAEYF